MKNFKRTLALVTLLTFSGENLIPLAAAKVDGSGTGVTTVEFGDPNSSSGSSGGGSTSTGAGSGTSTSGTSTSSSGTSPGTTGSTASTTTPTSTPVASTTVPFDFGNMSCDDRCSAAEGKLDFLNASAGSSNAQLVACVGTALGQSTVGRYCQAKTAYKKAVGPQSRALVLYGLAMAACGIACFADKIPGVGLAPKALCIGTNIAALTHELFATSQVTDLDQEMAGWALKADQNITKSVSVGASAVSAGIGAAQIAGAVAQVTSISKSSIKESCIAMVLLAVPVTLKTVSIADMVGKDKELCSKIGDQTDNITNSVRGCQTGYTTDGSGRYRNDPLSFRKPEAFRALPTEAETKAAMGTGLIADLYEKNADQFASDADKLPKELRSRIENGENAIDAMSALGFLPTGDEAGLREIQKHLKEGQKTAMLGEGGSAVPLLAGGEGASGKSAGSGVGFEAFGAAGVAASAAGEGVAGENFGKPAGSLLGGNASCGLGPLHEGCDRSLFRIVSDQLERKSKDESVAQLSPELPLNRMRAGLKVADTENRSKSKNPPSAAKRKPAAAAAPSRVK